MRAYLLTKLFDYSQQTDRRLPLDPKYFPLISRIKCISEGADKAETKHFQFLILNS